MQVKTLLLLAALTVASASAKAQWKEYELFAVDGSDEVFYIAFANGYH